MIQTTLRLPHELYAEIKQQARKRGLTLNAYILSILWSAAEARG